MKRLPLIALFLLLAPSLWAQTYALSVSKNADRSAAVALNGVPISGTVYVFTSQAANLQNFNLTGIASVSYWLDNVMISGPPTHVETLVPYDFKGTASTTTALPWDTTPLSGGMHTITQRVLLSAGTAEVDTATFTITRAIAISIAIQYDDGTPFAGSAEIINEKTNPDGSVTDTLVVKAIFNSSGVANASVSLDPALSYKPFLFNAAGTIIWPPVAAGNVFVLTAGFQLPALNAITISSVLRKLDNGVVKYSMSVK
jgi:hypothetical protein